MQNKGDCLYNSFPYNENDFLTQPTSAQDNEAKYFKNLGYNGGYLDGYKLRLLKYFIQNGNVATAIIPVSDDFDYLNESNDVYDEFDLATVTRGYHAICVVGYDDNKKAFKIINSWGDNWGIEGYGYISYDLFLNYQNEFGIYYMYDNDNTYNDVRVNIDDKKMNAPVKPFI